MKNGAKHILKQSVVLAVCCGLSSLGWATDTPDKPPTPEENAETLKQFEEYSNDLAERVKELEEKHDTPKLLAIAGDLDFLEELVFADNGSASVFTKSQIEPSSQCYRYVEQDVDVTNEKSEVIGKKTGTLAVAAVHGPGTIFLRGGQPKIEFRQNGEVIEPDLLCRLELIERQLFTEVVQSTKSDKVLKERLDEAYTELNHPDWQYENLRFGANVGYMKDLGVQTASIAFHVFPAYRRHTPGNLDLKRRLSFYLGLGNVFSGSGDVDVESAVLSAGIGVELIRGVSLNYGTSVFDSEEGETKTSEREDTISFSLRSEFWSSLFNNGQGN